MKLYPRIKSRKHLFNSFDEEYRYTINKNPGASLTSLLRIFNNSIRITLKALIKILDITCEITCELIEYMYERDEILLSLKH